MNKGANSCSTGGRYIARVIDHNLNFLSTDFEPFLISSNEADRTSPSSGVKKRCLGLGIQTHDNLKSGAESGYRFCGVCNDLQLRSKYSRARMNVRKT
jgi:hypothetical protein